jgi:hypothetical protein
MGRREERREEDMKDPVKNTTQYGDIPNFLRTSKMLEGINSRLETTKTNMGLSAWPLG